MQILSGHRRDCAMASHRPTSSMAWPLEWAADFKLFLANEVLRVWESMVAATRLKKCGTAGKVTPLKKLQKNPKYQKAFR